MLSKKCKQCNKEFFKDYFRSVKDWNNRAKFCSIECRNAFRRGKPFFNSGSFQKGQIVFVPPESRPRGEKNGKWKGGPKELTCKICGMGFMAKPYEVKAGRKFCSADCRKIYEASPASRLAKSETMKRRVALGLHNLYRGITELKALLRQITQYKQWRESVFIRDDFRCQFCGVLGEMNADHIKPFAVILIENNVKTLDDAINCQELWDVENGRTLCVECHKKTETYGRFVHAFINRQKVEIKI